MAAEMTLENTIRRAFEVEESTLGIYSKYCRSCCGAYQGEDTVRVALKKEKPEVISSYLDTQPEPGEQEKIQGLKLLIKYGLFQCVSLMLRRGFYHPDTQVEGLPLFTYLFRICTGDYWGFVFRGIYPMVYCNKPIGRLVKDIYVQKREEIASLMRELVDMGCQGHNYKNHHGISLYYTVYSSRKWWAVEVLDKCGARPDFRGRSGHTVISCFLKKGDEPYIRELVEKRGVVVSSKDMKRAENQRGSPIYKLVKDYYVQQNENVRNADLVSVLLSNM